MEKLICTPSEAAEMLSIGIDHLYRLLESGEIPAFKVGTHWKIPIATLKEYVIERAIAEARKRERKDIAYE